MGDEASVWNVWHQSIHEKMEIPEYIKMLSVRTYYGDGNIHQ
jgi:hypothetical protein